MESDRVDLHFPLLKGFFKRLNKQTRRCKFYKDCTDLDIDLVPAQHDRDVLAHPLKVAVPVGHIFIRDSGGHIEHDDPALALDVVPVAEPAELFLSRRVPDVEADRAEVGREGERVHLDAEGGWIARVRFSTTTTTKTKGRAEKRDGNAAYRCTSSRTRRSSVAMNY